MECERREAAFGGVRKYGLVVVVVQEVAGVREGEKEAIGERDKLREFGFEKLEAPKVMV